MVAITAATAATISAAGAIAGTAAAAGGTYMSFRGAAKERKKADVARGEADRLMQEARKRAEENVYKALSLSKEPYDRARESALVQGAQAIEAGMESERGSASTAGRIQMAQNELQRDIAGDQTQQIQELNKIVADEDARLADFTANVNMTEAAGAQLAAKDADEAAAAFTTQGVQGIANTAQVVGNALPLYYKTAGANQYAKLIEQGTAAGLNQEQIQNIVAAQGGSLAGSGYSKNSVDAKGNPIVGLQTPIQFQESLSGNPDLLKSLNKLNMFAPKPIQTTPYVERPSGGQSVLINDKSLPVKTMGSGYYGGASLNPFDIYGGR